MGWFDNTLGFVKNFYNGAKETVQAVYQPFKSIVNTIASGADTVNDFINRAKDIPILRDIASDTVGEIWGPLYSGIRDINDFTNMAGTYGSAIDQAVSGTLNAAGGRLG
jgi:hypothetical protein